MLNFLSIYLPVDIPPYIVYIHMGLCPSGMLLKYTLKLCDKLAVGMFKDVEYMLKYRLESHNFPYI